MTYFKAFFLLAIIIQAQVLQFAATQEIVPSIVALDASKSNTQALKYWGTSLCWWAVGVGRWTNYNGQLQELIDLLFSPTNSRGLKLNLARYNIGGGEAPRYAHFLRPGGFVQSYQPFPGVWDWNADASQRNVLRSAIQRNAGLAVQGFSNSPPWWMTVSGSVTGSMNGKDDNLRSDMYDEFANYLLQVRKYFAEQLHIFFDTLTPLNEPISNWWKFGNWQEGCHFEHESQNLILKALASASPDLKTKISAPEENSINDSLTAARIAFQASVPLDLIATHTYNGAKRAELREFAKQHGVPLWNSEYGTGNGPLQGGIELGMTICLDLNELQPEAWTLWQAVDLDNQLTQTGWGLIGATYDENPLVFAQVSVTFAAANKCLAAESVQVGAKIVVKDCAEAKEQLWLPDGASLLLGALCLDAWNESMQPGDKVSLYDCHDGKWTVQSDRIFLTAKPDLCLGLVSPQSSEITLINCSERTMTLVKVAVSGQYRPLNLQSRNDQPIEKFVIRKQFYAYKQFSSFITPGSRILQLTVLPGSDFDFNSQCVAAITPQKKLIVVLVNDNESDKEIVDIRLEAVPGVAAEAKYYVTDVLRNCVLGGTVKVVEHNLQVQLDAASITTFVLDLA